MHSKILLLVVSLALTFAIVEVGLRIRHYNPLGSDHANRHLILRESDDARRVYELTPGSKAWAWYTDVSVNRHGFRDRDYSIRKPDGVFRIVVLGDSTTFGSGLPVSDTYPSQLERQLRDERVEVLNLAVGGYDTVQEVATLASSGVRFEPDLVVLGFCVNDLGIVSTNLEYVRRARRYRSSRLTRSRLVQFVWVQSERLRALVEFRQRNTEDEYSKFRPAREVDIRHDVQLTRLVATLEDRLESTKHDVHQALGWYVSEARLSVLRAAFDELRTLSEAHDFSVVVAVIPYLGEEPLFELAYDIVEHEASRQGFDTLLLHADLKNRGLRSLRRWNSDPIHPSGAAHRLMANRLRDYIHERGFLD